MDDDQIEDLKRFIGTVISQQTSDLSKRLDNVEKKLDRLETKVDDGFAGIADTIEKSINSQLDDHEQRLTTLEQQAA